VQDELTKLMRHKHETGFIIVYVSFKK